MIDSVIKMNKTAMDKLEQIISFLLRMILFLFCLPFGLERRLCELRREIA